MNTARARWLTLGAILALLFGGTVLSASAAPGDGNLAFQPITPCRLVDTRPSPSTVGPRNYPIGPDTGYTVIATGNSGNCSIPSQASALVMNVTVIGPNASSYLTVYPSDVPRPVASSLNYTANQAPTPNQVTSKLSPYGQLTFYNLSGYVDIAVDVVGYYTGHNHDDRYYTKTEIDQKISASGMSGPPGPQGPQGPPGPAGFDPAMGTERYTFMFGFTDVGCPTGQVRVTLSYYTGVTPQITSQPCTPGYAGAGTVSSYNWYSSIGLNIFGPTAKSYFVDGTAGYTPVAVAGGNGTAQASLTCTANGITQATGLTVYCSLTVAGTANNFGSYSVTRLYSQPIYVYARAY